MSRLKKTTVACRTSVYVNRRQGSRQRLGMLLRDLAALVDGRLGMAVEVDSDPALSERDVGEIMNAGVEGMFRAAEQLVALEACDVGMRRLSPALFAQAHKAAKP